MNWKLICCSMICGVAALSPAPIKDPRGAQHVLPLQSAQQVAAEQKFDGTIGVVGAAPTKSRPYGTSAAIIESDSKAVSVLAKARIPSAQAKAIDNINVASKKLKLEGQGWFSPFWVGLFVLALVGGALYAAKNVLEKIGPAPKSFNPAERLR